MAKPIVGLDVGTNAVRVAVLDGGDRPRVRSFGQVALPPEAMREGEIADPHAVSTAIERLWKELGLKKGDVRVGVASPRVIVRPVELPAMDVKDLEGALRFQAQELIPIPLDDAVFDFQVLESFTDGEGNAMQRVLIAAAQREPVVRLAEVVRSAGLNPSVVDLVPLALVRSLGIHPVGDEGAEAVVSLGAGTTVIVVHQAGLPRFVRILGVGGRVLTEVAARDLELSSDVAEALKRRVAEAPAALLDRARGVLDRPLGDLLDEVRGSLDYYRTQADAVAVRRVVLTGGTALLPEVPERLSKLVGLPVVPGTPRDLVDASDIGFLADELPALDPFLSVPVGIALGGLATERRINLAPPMKKAAEAPRALKLVATALTVLTVAGVGFMTVGRVQAQADADTALESAQRRNTTAQSDLVALAPVQAAVDSIEAAEMKLTAIYGTEVSWVQVLDQIAATMPAETVLTDFQASASSAPGANGMVGTPVATLTISGRAASYDAVAAWIAQLETAPAVQQAWVSQAAATSDEVSGAARVDFQSEITIAPGVRSPRLLALEAEQGSR